MGQVPTMNKFVKFGAGISEDESETSNKNLMEKREKREVSMNVWKRKSGKWKNYRSLNKNWGRQR